MKKVDKSEKSVSTEEKIKEAARKVFTQKGYAATRTRDIAEEAGINLALLNYYFRSKEKLFQGVMAEKIHQVFGGLFPILNDVNTTLEDKIESIVGFYTDMLLENPDLPLFVLSEIKNNPKDFANTVQIKEVVSKSPFIKQLAERRPDTNPLQFMLSIIGMTVFPFIGKPVFVSSNIIEQEQYKILLLERKKLLPKWIFAMLDTR